MLCHFCIYIKTRAKTDSALIIMLIHMSVFCCMQPEPFFLTFALYSAKEGKKISEDFHFDANSNEIRSMLPSEVAHLTGSASHSRPTANGAPTSPSTGALDVKWLELQKQASVTYFNISGMLCAFSSSSSSGGMSFKQHGCLHDFLPFMLVLHTLPLGVVS